jgi:hypothetical protein
MPVRHPGRRGRGRRAPLTGQEAGDQIAAAADAGLAEDGHQVVLDGVGGSSTTAAASASNAASLSLQSVRALIAEYLRLMLG